jgi:hypothetical protein
VYAEIYRDIPILKSSITVHGDFRSQAAIKTVPVGAGMYAGDGTLARWGSWGMGLRSRSVVTLIYNGPGGQVYAWVAPQWQFCMLEVDPPGTTGGGGGGCGHLGYTAREGTASLRNGIGPQHTNTVVLLVPNGVRHATVRAGTRTLSIPVHNNVAAYTSTASLTASFRAPDGRLITEPTISHMPQGHVPKPRRTMPHPLPPAP